MKSPVCVSVVLAMLLLTDVTAANNQHLPPDAVAGLTQQAYLWGNTGVSSTRKWIVVTEEMHVGDTSFDAMNGVTTQLGTTLVQTASILGIAQSIDFELLGFKPPLIATKSPGWVHAELISGSSWMEKVISRQSHWKICFVEFQQTHNSCKHRKHCSTAACAYNSNTNRSPLTQPTPCLRHWVW
jgi:hypothetical protein